MSNESTYHAIPMTEAQKDFVLCLKKMDDYCVATIGGHFFVNSTDLADDAKEIESERKP